MSGGETRSKQTTTMSLPANQQRNVDELMSGALDYYRGGGRAFYPGDLIAGFDPAQKVGQSMLLDYAGGAGQDLVDQAISANSLFLNPDNIFNPGNIPGFQGAVDDLTRGYTTNLLENVLPSVRAGGTSSGQFGGSASGIGQALAVDRSNQALGDALSQMYLGAYGQGLGMFNNAISRAPALFGLGTLPGQIYSDVGATRQGQEQREIQADAARHEFEQNEPIFLLNLLRDLTGQYGQYGGTQTTDTRQKTDSSPINQALGGALSLASLWNPAASLFSGLAPQGPGAIINPAMLGQIIRGGGT